MENRIPDTLHPAISLIGTVLVSFLSITLIVMMETYSPEERNKYITYSIFIFLIIGLTYATFRQRSITFDGYEFTLRNAVFQRDVIDGSLFDKVEFVISNTYRIKFTDGRKYIFVINPYSKSFKDYFSSDPVPYDIVLTEQIKEMISGKY